MNQPMSVMDFIKGLIWHAYSHYLIENFPGPSDWRWHTLIYRIKKEIGPLFSEVDFGIRFDWDASGPRSGSVEEVLSGLQFIFEIDCWGRYRTELCNMETYRTEWKLIVRTDCAGKCYAIARSIEGFFEE